MRISDWSSDVCSSDLRDVLGRVAHMIAVEGVPEPVLDHGVDHLEIAHLRALAQLGAVRRQAHALLAAGDDDVAVAQPDRLGAQRDGAQARAAHLVHHIGGPLDRRSEEHTSELQSLMRISYAVFCLKKKKKKQQTTKQSTS